MLIKNTRRTYGYVAKIFHWVTVPLMLGVVIVGFYMHDLPTETPAEMIDKLSLYAQHKSFGLLILLLVILRLLWRSLNPSPALPASSSRLEKLSAHGLHIMLYVIMLVQPLSGWLMSSYDNQPVKFFGLTLPNLAEYNPEMSVLTHQFHSITGIVFIGLFIIHMAAALFHHFIRKDDIFSRMWFSAKKP